MKPDQKGINLALQGGGAHGAFAWGALDRLLAVGRLKSEGCSAAPGGLDAMAEKAKTSILQTEVGEGANKTVAAPCPTSN